MTVTIPTGDLCGILADTIPFALPGDDLPILNSVRLEWDGEQLHAMATDRYHIGWSTWRPDDQPDTDGDQQDDLFTEWGSGDNPWHLYIPLADAKDIVSNYKLPPKERGAALTVGHDWAASGQQLTVDRSRLTGHSALRMVVAGAVGDDFPDLRKLLADASTARPVKDIGFTPRYLADFAKVRPRGPLRMTFTGEGKLVHVTIGDRFVGAIQSVKEEADS